MMRSMFSGVSGLKTHQTKMDVIGNNIANVNTVGFKSGRVTFQEVFSQTMRGSGAPDTTSGTGGTNPMQVGLGIGLSSIDTNMTRGSVQRTDNPSDLAIEGDGFFVIKGGKADSYKFTRAGNFSIDKQGNLVSSKGYNVYGWQDYGGTRQSDGSYVYDTEKSIEPLNLYNDQHNKNKKVIQSSATKKAQFSGNLDAARTAITDFDTLKLDPNTKPSAQLSVPVKIYDALGNEYEVNISFWKTKVNAATATTTASSEWTWQVTSNSGSFDATTAEGKIKFGEDGKPIDGDTAFDLTPAIKLIPGGNSGTGAFDINVDFGKLTMYSSDGSVKPSLVDGYPSGNLTTFNIGTDGIITGIYSNGQQQPLGMIALASFENPAGLQKAGENMYSTTTNSGDFGKAHKAGSEGGVGTLSPGTLEMSNVDLSSEFTEMIVTQRGFQANSRIITASDEMLQELVNLKR